MTASSLFLLCLVGQVTLLACFTAFVYLMVRRHHPRAGATTVVTGALMIIVLTALGLSPWPRWLAEDAPERLTADNLAGPEFGEVPIVAEPPVDRSANRPAASTTKASPGTGAPLWSRLSEWWQSASDRWDRLSEALQRWSGVVSLLVIIAAIVGLLRLAAGWMSLRNCLRSSTLVRDRDMSVLLEQLREELSCKQSVELRESRLLCSAATVGWRSPIVLLPANWRNWSPDERRTVFAHELAHVASGDAPAWLAAQVALTLHFYHPLVHWLVHKLRIEQELAADAVAARISGGPRTYLETLAGLAVRQPDRPVAWPARPFLPERGTLLRRIEMLRDTRHRPEPASMFRRNLVIAAGVVAACVVAGLRPQLSLTNHAPADDQPAAAQDDQKADDPSANDDETKKTLARMASMNNMKTLGLAFHNYHDVFGHFPAPVVYGQGENSRSKHPHSWRVAILPFVGGADLYDQYRFDEPWNSERNLQIQKQMPDVFRSPFDKSGQTNAAYFVLVGEQTAVGRKPEWKEQPGKYGSDIDSITDGTSATMLVVAAKRDIPWTKPEDIPYSAEQDVPKLGGFDDDGFVSVFADGAAHFFTYDLPSEDLRKMITRNGGEAIDWGEMRRYRK